MHKKVTEVDRWFLGHTKILRKLTECPVDARTVDGRSLGRTERSRKVSWTHRKLTISVAAARKVDGRSPDCTESYWRCSKFLSG